MKAYPALIILLLLLVFNISNAAGIQPDDKLTIARNAVGKTYYRCLGHLFNITYPVKRILARPKEVVKSVESIKYKVQNTLFNTKSEQWLLNNLDKMSVHVESLKHDIRAGRLNDQESRWTTIQSIISIRNLFNNYKSLDGTILDQIDPLKDSIETADQLAINLSEELTFLINEFKQLALDKNLTLDQKIDLIVSIDNNLQKIEGLLDKKGPIRFVVDGFKHGWKVVTSRIGLSYKYLKYLIFPKKGVSRKAVAEQLHYMYENKLISFNGVYSLFKSINKANPERNISEYLKIDFENKTINLSYKSHKEKAKDFARNIAESLPHSESWKTFFQNINLTSAELRVIRDKFKYLGPYLENESMVMTYQSFIRYSTSFWESKTISILKLIDQVKPIDKKNIFDPKVAESKYSPYSSDYWKRVESDFKEGTKFQLKDNWVAKKFTSATPDYLAKFYRSLQEIEKRQYKTHKRMYKYLRATRKELLPSEAYDISRRSAINLRNYYETLHFGCSSKRSTDQHSKGLDSFSNYLWFIGLGSTGLGYWFNNDTVEKNWEWWAKLGYELAVITIVSKGLAPIFSSPTSGVIAKSAYSYGFNTVIEFGSSLAYQEFFGISEEDLEREYYRLQMSTNFDKRIKEILKYIEDAKMQEQFLQGIANAKGYLVINNKEDNVDFVTISQNPISAISKKDLVNEKLVDLMARVIAYQTRIKEIEKTYTEYLEQYQYDSYLGLTDEVLTAKIDELLESDDYQDQLESIIDTAQKMGLSTKFRRKVNEIRLDEIKSGKGINGLSPWKFNDFQIHKEDLSNPEIMHLIKSVMAAQIVEKDMKTNPEKVEFELSKNLLSMYRGVDKAVINDLVEDLMSDKEYLKVLNEFTSNAEKLGLKGKISQEIQNNNVANLIKNYEYTTPDNWEQDVTNIDRTDLDNDDVKEALLYGIAREFYEKQSGNVEWMKTGRIWLDRFIYGRTWNAITTLKKVMVAYFIYQLLCNAGTRKPESVMIALAISVVDKYISENFYFKFRNWAIGQNPQGTDS